MTVGVKLAYSIKNLFYKCGANGNLLGGGVVSKNHFMNILN